MTRVEVRDYIKGARSVIRWQEIIDDNLKKVILKSLSEKKEQWISRDDLFNELSSLMPSDASPSRLRVDFKRVVKLLKKEGKIFSGWTSDTKGELKRVLSLNLNHDKENQPLV